MAEFFLFKKEDGRSPVLICSKPRKGKRRAFGIYLNLDLQFFGGRGASSSSGNGLPNKTVMKNTSKYSGYAKELAEVVKGDEVYQIKYNGGEAFADAYVNSVGELRIDYIGSTGKGAGSEMLARLAEKALSENRNLTWMAEKILVKSILQAYWFEPRYCRIKEIWKQPIRYKA